MNIPVIADQLIFCGLSSLMFFCSIMVVTRRNPIASAIYLVGTLFLVAATYAFLGADFVAAIQILVYAGAIMVLFVFVIMLLNLDPDEMKGPRISVVEIGVMLVSIIAFLSMGFAIFRAKPLSIEGPFSPEFIAEAGGNTLVVGIKLFQDYVWPFELASFLILLAIVASVFIAKKHPKEVA